MPKSVNECGPLLTHTSSLTAQSAAPENALFPQRVRRGRPWPNFHLVDFLRATDDGDDSSTLRNCAEEVATSCATAFCTGRTIFATGPRFLFLEKSMKIIRTELVVSHHAMMTIMICRGKSRLFRLDLAAES